MSDDSRFRLALEALTNGVIRVFHRISPPTICPEKGCAPDRNLETPSGVLPYASVFLDRVKKMGGELATTEDQPLCPEYLEGYYALPAFRDPPPPAHERGPLAHPSPNRDARQPA
ncbi:hypothetical protein CE91St30_09050 [Raoultibacter timonensis]|uniref:Uncharacterized protein n=1 Tax=Raoultibacter timonensis TaxID=1907662 RepID=A0ABM7WH44_9ACTN|nr:hypothetical protein CE91St30_09050 [Raoultibacter timonensis]BDF50176.1 hypothetical protein CE91St31_09060 [Raoultibacter timonensis]